MPETIWVCTDCMLEHHYPGEMEGTGEEWRNYPNAKLGSITAGILCDRRDDDYHLYESDEHSEECETLTFSWFRCDGCGSTLGGSRHAFTVWED